MIDMTTSRSDRRSLRLQETIYPFGVGAIVDILGESFIGMDITTWPKEKSPELTCRPLQKQLGQAKLRQAPVSNEFGPTTWSVPYERFPKWRFCQDCSRMSNKMAHDKGRTENLCLVCKGKMVPMRFVAVCAEGGHVQDIAWPHWVHRRSESEAQRQCKDTKELELRTKYGRGEGLSAVVIHCRACNAERSMGPLASEKGLHNEGYKCYGRQPWEPQDIDSGCDSELRAIQRGSTSLYMADIVSAIDIPEAESKRALLDAAIRSHDLFQAIKGQGSGPMVDLAVTQIADQAGATEEHVRLLFEEGAAGPLAEMKSNLRSGEWSALERAVSGDGSVINEDFIVTRSDYPSPDDRSSHLDSMVNDVGLVHRLREVRALTGFRRYKQTASTRVDLGLFDGAAWYPAIELFGEGIFIRFDEDAIRDWESQSEVQKRVQHFVKHAENLTDPNAKVAELSPRFIMLHTLSHLLMRRLEFHSGYSAASLSERIYATSDPKEPQAGLLIFTSAGDSQGTLGGLVRLGEAAFLGRLLLGAVEDADRCSNDPVCRASRGQGLFNMNLAACHACSLVPETSCEQRNTYLDRGMLVEAGGAQGFFQAPLDDARKKLAS